MLTAQKKERRYLIMTETVSRELTKTIILYKPIRKMERTISVSAESCNTICTNDCMIRGNYMGGLASLDAV